MLDHGLLESARSLERESGVSLAKTDAADNVDLKGILKEWEGVYEAKFGRRPKIVRKAGEDGDGVSVAAAAARPGKAGATSGKERRAARIEAERSALRRAEMARRAAEATEAAPAPPSAVTPPSFDLPPGHPLLRQYAGNGAVLEKPPGGTTLSNCMDYLAKRDRERKGLAPAPGEEHLGHEHSAAVLGNGKYGGFMGGRRPGDHLRGEVREGMGGGKEGKRPPRPPNTPSPLGGEGWGGDGGRGRAEAGHPGPGDAAGDSGGGGRTAEMSQSLGDASVGEASSGEDHDVEETDEDWDARQRLLKPPPTFGGSAELRELAHVIQRDIYTSNPNVRWNDVAGLDEAKKLLKEAVVMPVKYPQFFHGLLEPWKGILLYGPPGTGKTMLAKAVATECGTTFFNISASSIVSKWRGDSEKLVRVLFELARHHAPSTVFMDELDAVMSARDGGGGGGGGGGDHESSRRLKTELLIQLDGLAKGGELVFLLAATNLPWELDPAMLRRLEKRILVPLPNDVARLRMMERYLHPHAVAPEVDLGHLATRTAGYSGSDVMLLCKECAMRPLRRLMSRLDEDLNPTADMCAGGEEVQVGDVTAEDVEGALGATKPSYTNAHARRYEEWTASFGMTV